MRIASLTPFANSQMPPGMGGGMPPGMGGGMPPGMGGMGGMPPGVLAPHRPTLSVRKLACNQHRTEMPGC